LSILDYSLFAQDAYSRPDLSGDNVIGTKFNGAEIIDEWDIQDDGFYAIAYDTGSEIIIAYRGTDGVLTDVINGWGGGAGLWFSDQNQLAIEFYHEVNSAYPGREISVTGHSLGGGLAGFVSGITGAEAHVFDNMTYELSANLAQI
jgi:putative lipase involved disintegration of autophagic bodies